MLERSRYVIDFNHSNYISAILTYNKFSTISEIDGKKIEPIIMDNLKEILAIQNEFNDKMSQRLGVQFKKGITIVVDKIDSYCTIGILPAFKSIEILKSTDLTKIDNAKVDKVISEIISHQELVQKEEHKDNKLKIDPLYMDEAYFLLTKLHDPFVICGAMHIAATMQIVFQVEGTDNNYVLTYGQNASFRKMQDFSLDIDEGFSQSKKTKEDSHIISRLQTYFDDWKSINYEGDLIPQVEAKFVKDSSALIINLRNGGKLLEQFYNPEVNYIENAFRRHSAALKEQGCDWVDDPVDITSFENQYGDLMYCISPKSPASEEVKLKDIEKEKTIIKQHDIIKEKLLSSFSVFKSSVKDNSIQDRVIREPQIRNMTNF